METRSQFVPVFYVSHSFRRPLWHSLWIWQWGRLYCIEKWWGLCLVSGTHVILDKVVEMTSGNGFSTGILSFGWFTQYHLDHVHVLVDSFRTRCNTWTETVWQVPPDHHQQPQPRSATDSQDRGVNNRTGGSRKEEFCMLRNRLDVWKETRVNVTDVTDKEKVDLLMKVIIPTDLQKLDDEV